MSVLRSYVRDLAVSLAVLAISSGACVPAPVVPTPDAPDAQGEEAGVEAPAPTPMAIEAAPALDACDRAYRHLQAISCAPNGSASGSWADVCRADRKMGLFGLKCIEAAASAADAKKCGVTCPAPHADLAGPSR